MSDNTVVNNTSSEKKRNAVRLGGGSIFATLIGTFGYFGSYVIDFLDRLREINNRLVVLERIESEMVKGARFIWDDGQELRDELKLDLSHLTQRLNHVEDVVFRLDETATTK
ncbi:MAG: hypothetical protein VSS75_028155 [Candidatus Parabeggiatoa sp.]|nr:hypothetical protein [Candidatus Parabeggiatoa sp.]